MSATEDICQFCNKEKFKYVCPKCNRPYCSLNCYKSPEHIKCSEEFYKNCIQDELSSAQSGSKDDMRKIYDILKRIRESDAGMSPFDFEDCLAEPLDSDDEQIDKIECADDDVPNEDDINVEDYDENDIATRLQNIDINDADEVWKRLTSAERQDFQNMVESGEIMTLVPDYKAWWYRLPNSKIVEISSEANDKGAGKSVIPEIAENIPKFESICKKSPSPCIHYNLWNIIAAYAATVRYYRGEHLTIAGGAAANFVNLCVTLKYGTNFEDTEDAIVSVEMEALTTAHGPTTKPNNFIDNREQLQDDCRRLMSTRENKLAALSDILQLFKLAKKLTKGVKGAEQAEFQKIFALSHGSVELSKNKLQQFIKKIEFFLSYVQREHVNELL